MSDADARCIHIEVIMKSQLACILFSLVTTASACSGRSSTDDPVAAPVPTAPAPKVGFGSGTVDAPVVTSKPAPVEVKPAIEEHVVPATLAECLKLGKQMEAKGDHVYARELFEAAAKLDREAMLPEVELARSYIATNERALAVRHARKAVKLAPESSLAYNTLGRAELLRKSYDAAELAFRQATELDIDNVWAWNNLGLVYLTQKNYDEAVNALVEATGHKGTEGYMWNNLGTAYEHLDRLDDARDAFDNGAKLGSVAARASRKRLEGVESIAVATGDSAEVDGGFEIREPMPEDLDTDGTDEPVIEDVVTEVDDEPAIDGTATADVAKPDVEAKPEVKAEAKPEATPEATVPKADPPAAPSTTL